MHTKMKYLLTSSVIVLLIKVSQPENNIKLKDVMKNSSKFNNNSTSTTNNNGTNDNEDVLKNEISKIKGQCVTDDNGKNAYSNRNSETNRNQSVYDANYGDNGNNKNYSSGRFNRNDQESYQNSGYSNNRNWGRNDNNGYGQISGTNQPGYNQYTTSNSDNPYTSYDRNSDGTNQYTSGNNQYSSGYNGQQGTGNQYKGYDNGYGDMTGYRNNYDSGRYNNRYNLKTSNNERCRDDSNTNRQRGNQERNNYGPSDHSRGGRTNYNGYNTQRTKRSDKIEYMDQCTSQCIFGHLEVLDDEQVPSETAFIKWVQDHVKDNDLKRIQTLRQVRRCFSRTATKDTNDGCEYSKELSKCLNLDLE